jgi:hypothetical protein
MNRKTIKPVNGSEKYFRISTRRIQSGLSTKNKSGKTYQLIRDLAITKLNYQSIVATIPAQPGTLILSGHNKVSVKTLEIITSNESLRSAFSKPENINRLQILIQYIDNHSFDYLQIQLAQES